MSINETLEEKVASFHMEVRKLFLTFFDLGNEIGQADFLLTTMVHEDPAPELYVSIARGSSDDYEALFLAAAAFRNTLENVELNEEEIEDVIIHEGMGNLEGGGESKRNGKVNY